MKTATLDSSFDCKNAIWVAAATPKGFVWKKPDDSFASAFAAHLFPVPCDYAVVIIVNGPVIKRAVLISIKQSFV